MMVWLRSVRIDKKNNLIDRIFANLLDLKYKLTNLKDIRRTVNCFFETCIYW